VRGLHTSRRPQAPIAPVIMAMLGPVFSKLSLLVGKSGLMKMVALNQKTMLTVANVSGRVLPWMNHITRLSPALKRGRPALVALFAGVPLLVGIVAVDQCPFSGRWRFIVLSEEQERSIGREEAQNLLQNFKVQNVEVLTENHPLHHAVDQVIQEILAVQLPRYTTEAAEKVDAFQRALVGPEMPPEWRVHVVMDCQRNACALPSGDIFLHAGMIALCQDAQMLSVVLSHEICHVLCRHGVEAVSQTIFWDGTWGFLKSMSLTMTWMIGLPLLAASITAHTVLVDLPYSRHLEEEADCIGMELHARAGFNPEAVPELWARMMQASRDDGELMPSEWVSTHPSHEHRQRDLAALVPTVLPIYRSVAEARPVEEPTSRPWGRRVARAVLGLAMNLNPHQDNTIEFFAWEIAQVIQRAKDKQVQEEVDRRAAADSSLRKLA